MIFKGLSLKQIKQIFLEGEVFLITVSQNNCFDNTTFWLLNSNYSIIIIDPFKL